MQLHNRLILKLLKIISPAINHMLQLNSSCYKQLTLLNNIKIRIDILSISASFTMQLLGTEVIFLEHENLTADLHIKGDLSILMALLINKNMALALKRGLIIDGDTETLHQIQNLLQTLVLDFEELVAFISNDSVANLICSYFKQKNIYLQHYQSLLLEKAQEVLISEGEANSFIDKVDLLRARIDRLAAKINQLNSKFPSLTSQDLNPHEPN